MLGIKLDYDSEFDILYIGISDTKGSYESEVINKVSVFRDFDTDIVVGFLIYGFMEKHRNGALPSIPHCPHIDYEKDILPCIKLKATV